VLEAEPEDPSFRVFADNWPIVQTWCAVWRQWRWLSLPNGVAVRAGLDYQQVQAALEMQRIPRRRWPEIFTGLREMEDEVLALLAED
jgi:hypothetical protein